MNQTTKRQPSPGPWTVSVNRSQGTFSVWDEYGNYHETKSADMDANAQLIATAPDLLEALKAMRAEYDPLYDDHYSKDLIKLVDRAISKASL